MHPTKRVSFGGVSKAKDACDPAYIIGKSKVTQ